MFAQHRDTRIRVLLADDSDTIRKVVRMLLDGDSGIQVVGEAANKTELFRMLGETRVDVLVVDLHLCAEHSAVQALTDIPGLGVVMMSALVGSESTALTARLGIKELLEKADLPDTLVRAIKTACSRNHSGRLRAITS